MQSMKIYETFLSNGFNCCGDFGILHFIHKWFELFQIRIFTVHSARYERFTTTYYEEYKDKLTEEDLVEIGRLQGRFMKASMTRGAKFIEKNFNDAMQQASGLLDGLFEVNEDEE